MTNEQPPERPNDQPPVRPNDQPPVRPQSPQNPFPRIQDPGPDPDYKPFKETGFTHILNHLLKKPLSVIYEINHGKRSLIPELLLIMFVCLGIFGLVLGMFSAGAQLWVAPVKVMSGVLISGLICLPSLYIFGSLGGMNVKFQDVLGLMVTFLAVTSLLLVGFAPVVWLFSTSSNSIVFFGFLSLVIWFISLIFGLRIITRASRSMGGGSSGAHLKVWAIIFVIVTIQMTTTLRPIIGKSDKLLNLNEKRFFLQYWYEVIDAESNKPYRKIDKSNGEERRGSSYLDE